MVHALEQIHRLLTPHGVLIDIRPMPELPHVEADLDGRTVFSEPLQVSYLDGIKRAEGALAHVVQSGRFVLENKIVVDFRHHAAAPAALYSHWDTIEPYSDTPKDPDVAASEEAVFSRLAACFQTGEPLPEAVIRERASLSSYIPIRD